MALSPAERNSLNARGILLRNLPPRSAGVNRHSPDCCSTWGIFRPVAARCNENRPAAGCADGQIVGLAAAKGWSASHGLHQGTPRPPPSSHLLPLPLMPAQAVHAVGRSATGFRRTSGG